MDNTNTKNENETITVPVPYNCTEHEKHYLAVCILKKHLKEYMELEDGWFDCDYIESIQPYDVETEIHEDILNHPKFINVPKCQTV